MTSLKQAILTLLPQRIYLELIWLDFKINRKQQFNRHQNIRKTETNESYSYKPFDDNKAIFIHIPKCAGVSVNKALFGNLAGGHTTLEDYMHIS